MLISYSLFSKPCSVIRIKPSIYFGNLGGIKPFLCFGKLGGVINVIYTLSVFSKLKIFRYRKNTRLKTRLSRNFSKSRDESRLFAWSDHRIDIKRYVRTIWSSQKWEQSKLFKNMKIHSKKEKMLCKNFHPSKNFNYNATQILTLYSLGHIIWPILYPKPSPVLN